MLSEPISPEEDRRLQAVALRVRERILRIVHDAGSGHVGGALSQADVARERAQVAKVRRRDT